MVLKAIQFTGKLALWSFIILFGIALYDAFTRPTPVILEILSSSADESFATFQQGINDAGFEFESPQVCLAKQEKDQRCPTLVGVAHAPSYTRALNLKRRVIRVANGEGVRVNVDVNFEFIKYTKERFSALFGFL